jgi:glycosyltransferase involved in cell wall biosynthesis
MNLYNISTDEKLLDKSSRQYARVAEYLDIVDGLHFYVFTKVLNLREIDNSENGKSFKVVPVYGGNKIQQLIKLLILFAKLKPKTGDVISPQDPFELGLLSYIISIIFNLKLCVQMHTDTSSKYFKNESIRNTLQYYISFLIFKKAYSIRVVSERMKSYLIQVLRINENKIHVIPLYIDLSRFELKRQQKTEKSVDLLMLSRIERVKNIDLAIDAVHYINKKRKQNGDKLLTLRIVGNGSDKDRLQLKYKSEDYDFVTWVDYVVKVEEEYARAKIFLISSTYEGYAATAVEALSSYLPVVMTPVGCAGQIILPGISGEVSKDLNILSYIEAIETCLKRQTKNDYRLESMQSNILNKAQILAKYEQFIK